MKINEIISENSLNKVAKTLGVDVTTPTSNKPYDDAIIRQARKDGKLKAPAKPRQKVTYKGQQGHYDFVSRAPVNYNQPITMKDPTGAMRRSMG